VGDKIREIFHSDSLSIRIYDPKTNLLSSPYLYESGERIMPAPVVFEYIGFSGHVMHTRETLVINENMKEAMEKYGSYFLPGTQKEKSAIFVPLVVGEQARGLVSMSDFESEHAFSDSDVRLLQTLVNSMSVALENARLFNETQRLLAETEQRNNELAIINSVQAALAAELNIQGIYDAVGDKIREIFHSGNLEIRIYDPRTNLEHYPYTYENGKRIHLEPLQCIDTGIRAHVARTRETLVINENYLQTTEKFGSYTLPGTQDAKSAVYVPLIVGDQVRGMVGLSDFEREHAFSDSDVRLLQTLVNSMSVALENARLFTETQRLLEETSQRASELAIINSVSQSMSSQLQVEAIVRTVGDQVRDSFHLEVVNIYLYDPATSMIHLPYSYDRQYVTTPPFAYGSGLTSKVMDAKQPLILGSFEEITSGGAILTPNAPDDELMPQSYLGVPIIVGEKAIGVIDVQSYKQFVYDDSHVRLLSTLASSMGVALENARLFEETRRLLAETEQRNRELAIISRIGQSLAGQLDPQGIFELVGEELQQVFDAQVVAIITYDRQENLAHWRYSIEKGERQSVAPHPPGGFSGHILRTRQPLLITHDVAQRAVELGSTVLAGEAPKSYLGVPLIAGGEVTGVITLQNIDREEAFSEDDLRLLSTLALSMGVTLENARLYQETQHHAVEMAALAEIGSDIASTHEMEPVLERMATKTRELMEVRDIAMYLLQPDGHTLKPIVSQGKYAEETKAQMILLGTAVTGSIAQSGVAEIVNYPERDPRALHIEGTPPEEEDLECIMLAPLISRGRVIGVMSVYRDRDQGLFTQLELDFLVSLARQAAIAIESARLYAETERRATEMAALAEVSREISATLELHVVLERIAGQARELLAAGSSAVYLLQPDGKTIKAIAAEGDIADEVLADEVQLGIGIVGSIVQSGVAEWINDTGQDTRGVQIPGTQEIPEGEKLMVAPLLTQERAIGALAVWRDPDDPPFNQAELSFAIGLAQQAVVAIENARLFETAQESQRRMADIIDFLPDATLVIDRQGKVIAWNHAIEEMTGVKAADILGKGDYEYALPFYSERRPILIDMVLIPDEELESKYAHIQRNEGVLVGEAYSQLKGQMTYLNATASALKNSKGEAVGAIESIRDITDQKRAEQELHQAKVEAEAANQAKSAFLAMMSHEIRTPMNAIIGMSGLLMDTSLNPDQREFAETIRSSGDSLLTIINDILDFSKIEAGKMTLEEQPFDLRECIEASLDLMKMKASEKGLELAYQMEPGVPPALLGDVTRLRQVLINLLGNSVKFTEQGEIVLTVSKGEKKGSLHFSVRDTGIGIPPDRVSQLFRPFTQADTSTSRRYGGTGLGLALSSRLVDLMGGRMWVESEGVTGKGSTFHFIIFAKPAPDWKGQLHMQGEHPQLRGRRMLVVDDNATNRRILELQTQNWGMLPRGCPSGSEALEILRKGEPFDLAILDMHMPEMSGVDLASEIRKMEASRPGVARLPLVLSTSLGGREEARESMEFTAILLKPIRQSALFDVLINVFAGEAEPVVKPAPERVTLDPGMASRRPLRILLAEDNVVNQKLALRLLSQMSYRADVAANGLEVLQAVKRQPYDVIFMDVQMPEMDGLEATRRLCAELSADKRPRIIAMTANAMQGDREICLEAGMDDYLSKPIRVEELVAALNLAKPLSSG
jgi:PAS domain S-box-containing protein